jgi:hypothetical protein
MTRDGGDKRRIEDHEKAMSLVEFARSRFPEDHSRYEDASTTLFFNVGRAARSPRVPRRRFVDRVLRRLGSRR